MKVTSITRYDPSVTRDYSTLKIGMFTVLRQPLRGTPHTLYSVMNKDGILGRLISYPSADDCAAIARQARYAKDRKAMMSEEEVDEAIEAAGGLGSLTNRIVNLLKVEKMGLAKLGKTLKADPNALSPILNRLVNRGAIIRRGAARKYVYEASQA